MSLLKPFLQFIANRHLFSRKDRLLLAVSGGMDSVCLLHLCKMAGFDFAVAHVNFLLRGEESNKDEKLVSDLALKYEVDFFLHREDAEKYAAVHHVSVQVAAREIRYQFFNKLIIEKNVTKYILTAHHADDNAETLMMNFLKGTGIEGLKGIPALNGLIRRPLLSFTRDQIADYVAKNNLYFREDASNLTDKYTRNFIRLAVFPVLEKVFPSVKSNLSHNVNRFEEISYLYFAEVNRFFKKHLSEERGEWKISVEALKRSGAASTLLFEWLKNAGFSAAQCVEAERLIYSESGKMITAGAYRLLHNRKHLVLSNLTPVNQEWVVINDGEVRVEFTGGIINIQNLDKGDLPSDEMTALLDGANIQFPLLLRRWRAGDYMYPLGMNKKKKIARMLIDKRCSMNEKENVWVIESNKKIIWLIGHRIDNRFKITANTKKFIRIRLSSKK